LSEILFNQLERFLGETILKIPLFFSFLVLATFATGCSMISMHDFAPDTSGVSRMTLYGNAYAKDKDFDEKFKKEITELVAKNGYTDYVLLSRQLIDYNWSAIYTVRFVNNKTEKDSVVKTVENQREFLTARKIDSSQETAKEQPNDVTSVFTLGLGFYIYNLAPQDYVVNPSDASSGYHTAVFNFSGSFFTFGNVGPYFDVSYGLGTVDRGFQQSFSPDFTSDWQGFVGLAMKGNTSGSFLLHCAGGVESISIKGQDDYQTHPSGSSIHFAGQDSWSKFLNNYGSNSGIIILGYPGFSRTAFAMNLGLKYSFLYCDYIPVFVKPLRSNFRAGVCWSF
jgi:hypothetical protein